MSTNEGATEANAPPAIEEIQESLRQTAALMAKNAREMAELKEQTKDTDRRMKDTDRRMKDTDRRMKDTDRRLKKAEGLFTTQWGKLMESLVEGDLVPLLRERGIDVTETMQRVTGRRNGEHYEFDIVAANGTEAVVVEVKTTLRPEDVADFLDRMSWYAERLRSRAGQTVYGAVAYLRCDQSVVRYAERKGLFVIRATGSSASIVNPPDFEPRVLS